MSLPCAESLESSLEEDGSLDFVIAILDTKGEWAVHSEKGVAWMACGGISP